MKKYKVFVLAFALLLVVSACSSGGETNMVNEVKLKSVDLLRDVKKEEKEVKIKGNEGVKITDFGLNVLKKSMVDGENIIVSPLSIVSAMGMTASGADGNTLAEMESTFGLKVGELNNYFHNYYTKSHIGMNVANGIWFKDSKDLKMNKDYLKVLKNDYSCSAYKAPFDDTTKDDINGWVKEKTEGMIPKLIDEISKDTYVYLINAVAFDRKWDEPSDVVVDGVFKNSKGEKKNVKYIYSVEGSFINGENAQGIIKPYRDNKYEFVAILPNEGVSIKDFVSSLSGEKLDKLIKGATPKGVETRMPKFKYEYSKELNKVLKDMGIKEAFKRESADFSKMQEGKSDLFISKVLHKTFIDFNESGTRAAAATKVEMKKSEAMVTKEKVYFNRPFP